MRILLFGRDGQLGREIFRFLSAQSDLVAVDQAEVDLTNLDKLTDFIQEVDPAIIVNAAAYTQVDRAESERDLAYQINAVAPGCMAEQANKTKAVFIHFSTDFVFDGNKVEPYTESDIPHPLSVYGSSKLEGEERVLDHCDTSLILRTSWLYGDRRRSFPWKVLEWAHSQEVVRVVDDQIGSPTWSVSLAHCTHEIIKNFDLHGLESVVDVSGIYHLAGRGFISRFGWAKAIINLDPDKSNQRLTTLAPAKSHEFSTPAMRPEFSALDSSKAEKIFGITMRDWESELRSAMEVDG
jgi:dTDP-4-dehydrorhamnose reductase